MTLELFELNPKAKVILGIRETFEEWYESATKTILWSINQPKNPRRELFKRMLPQWFANHTESKKVPETKEEFRVSYSSWIEHIKSNIPAEQLLNFKPNDGWEPLCKFLGKEVPEVKYPAKNKKEVFIKNKGVVKNGE